MIGFWLEFGFFIYSLEHIIVNRLKCHIVNTAEIII